MKFWAEILGNNLMFQLIRKHLKLSSFRTLFKQQFFKIFNFNLNQNMKTFIRLLNIFPTFSKNDLQGVPKLALGKLHNSRLEVFEQSKYGYFGVLNGYLIKGFTLFLKLILFGTPCSI